MNYYISDLHLGHMNVIKFDNRPFKSVNEMFEVIKRNWNNTVTANDDVWIIGDFCYKSGEEPAVYLSQLNGKKHLIRGNHDKAILNSKNACKYLESIDFYRDINDNGRHVILCHYPIAEWDGMFHDSYHVFGHIHKNFHEAGVFMHEHHRDRAFNAGCMVNGYKPCTLDELAENTKKRTLY